MIKPATFIARLAIVRSMREEEALAALGRLGLTRKEAKAYLVLVRNGSSTASEVSRLLEVQYPAVYRVLHSLQGKGWIEASRDRPNRYRARNPRVVAEQARQAHAAELGAAAEQTAALAEEYTARPRGLESDLYLYKGPEGVGNKLREVVLSASGEVLVVSPFAVDPEVLRMILGTLRRSRQRSRIILNQANAADVEALRGDLGGSVRVELRFPAMKHPDTRLAHTFVFPSDRELFILNSFYRDGSLVLEKLQGLWIGDADYVRLQLEAMVRGLATPPRRRARALPTG
jgi:sugar-specific transcriptional regulator TrmB